MGALILVLVLYGITVPFISVLKKRHPRISSGLISKLFWYHMLFALIYYIYVQSSASDSVAYYERAKVLYETWFDAYGTGTTFIDFLAYPFIQLGGFSYEAMMVLFAYFGYVGFVCFYIMFRENLQFNHTIKGIDLLGLLMFLPNMHYWTASLGKGSIIFLGLGLTVFALSKMKGRMLLLGLGLSIVYHVRPHVFFLLAVGIVIGLVTGRQKVSPLLKYGVLMLSAAAIVVLFDDILAFASLDGENLLESFDQFSSHRASELAKSGSGIDISNYPLAAKLFTFWFRPLFVDAPGPIGIIVSVENLFCLFLTFKLIQRRFITFFVKSTALVKTNAVMFFGVSYALSGTLSNLGIIIRQKSMVMYFLLFIVIVFLDHLKAESFRRRLAFLRSKRRTSSLQHA